MPQIQEHGEIETVVRSHAGWVHACANRRVGNEAMAQDVTQAVFILFWRKRGRLGEEVKLTGWLYRAVRCCAADALRIKRIQERHEREAAMAGRRDRSYGEATWNEVSPELEEAVDRLSERDRAAVLMRFYRQMSFAEVGKVLGISEKSAQKRVERAVGRLREKLAGKGVAVEAGSLGAMVLAHAVEGGPAGLAEKVMAGIGGGAGNGTAGLIAKGAMKMMVWTKVKITAVAVGIILVGAAAAPFLVRGLGAGAGSASTQPAGVAQASLPAQVPGDALSPDRGVVVNVCRKWRMVGWGDNEFMASGYALSYASGHPVFRVVSPGKYQTWIYYLDQPIDFNEYPMLVLRYRARHLDRSPDRYGLWMDDSSGPNTGDLVPILPRDLIDDGQEHEFRCDIRPMKPKGPFTGMALRVFGDNSGQCELELLDMRLEATEDSEPVTPLEEGAALAVKVVDEKQQPVEGAVVVADAERRNFARKATTGADGVASVTPLAAPDHKLGLHGVRVERDGYVPTELPKVGTGGASPVQVTLFKSVRLSGQVVDPEGKPVSQVAVYGANGDPDSSRPLMDQQTATVTDDQGRWALTLADSERYPIVLSFSHPDYLAERLAGKDGKGNVEEMRLGKGIVPLRRGITVTGIVRNTNGNPVAGATVLQGQGHYSSSGQTATVTDQDGRYRFGSVAAGALALTVQARGYAPELLVTQVEAGMKPVDFVLKFGKVVRIRVVDQAGNPIDRVYVSVQSWRGSNTISPGLRTNADGRVVWDSAPEDAVVYAAYVEGYMSVRDKSIVASDEEQVITLPSPLKISGSVTDAQTGELIRAFNVVMGVQFAERSEIVWQRGYRPKPGPTKEGQYDYTFSSSYPGMVLQVEAEGYQPAISRVFKSDEGTQTYDFKLNKAKVMPIRILTPDGKPAAGAEAAVATASENVFVRDGAIVREQSAAAVKVTNSEGVYSLPPLAEAKGTVLIIHGSGYIEIPYEQAAEAKELRLNAWGKVEAILKVGANVAGQRMLMSRTESSGQPGEARIYEQLEDRTDASGRCVFNRVRAGTVQVSYGVPYDNGTVYSHSKRVTVEAGQSTSVVIGGEGRPVSGRVEIPADLPAGWRFDVMHISSRRLVKPPPLPEGFQNWPAEKRRAWVQEFQKTDAGKAYLKLAEEEARDMRSFACPMNADGTFRIEDIPAGTYTAQVSLFQPGKNANGWPHEGLGVATGEFTMPEAPGGKSTEVLDVGVLKVTRQTAATAPTTKPNGAK